MIKLFSFDSISLSATPEGLALVAGYPLERRDQWPLAARQAMRGFASAIELEQMMELDLAQPTRTGALIPFSSVAPALEDGFRLPTLGTVASPFFLKIDRNSDIGHSNFSYKYKFLLNEREIPLRRIGPYAHRESEGKTYLLDSAMYSLVEAMDTFNALSEIEKTKQRSWLAFAEIKGLAKVTKARMDLYLESNDVILPSTLGLDVIEEDDGSLSFLPNCAELATEEFHQVFRRNPQAETFYSQDKPNGNKVRIVLTDQQHQALQRLKRVSHYKGNDKETLKKNPEVILEGLGDVVTYGDRVIGIGTYNFAPMPSKTVLSTSMGSLADEVASSADGTHDRIAYSDRLILPPDQTDGIDSAHQGFGPTGESTVKDDILDSIGKVQPAGTSTADPTKQEHQYLLIETNEQSVKAAFLEDASKASQLIPDFPYIAPKSLQKHVALKPHQEKGVHWLQICSRIPGRRGALLADDMGVGKTIQILSFLAWCIESGQFPDLSRSEPPFRPILIVTPLILLETRTWQNEMEKFFEKQGVCFWPHQTIHSANVEEFRHQDLYGKETLLARPLLDPDRIQRYKVIFTNYDTLKNYHYSFAQLKKGKSLFSVVISDEAQEYKVPSTKLSHAMKAIRADFHMACTGTPVENSLRDLWNICDTFQPGLLKSAEEFKKEHEKELDHPEYEEAISSLKAKLLYEQKHAYLLRRNKSDVAALPPKSVRRLYCSMSALEVAQHQEILKDLKATGSGKGFLKVLHRLSDLYQHPSLLESDGQECTPQELLEQSSKLRTVVEELKRIRSKHEKALIFARSIAMQSLLARVLEHEFNIPVRIINGLTKSKATSANPANQTRGKILSEFRESSGFGVLILSPFVAGIGLTITEANHVIHYGRWWNPAVESQATDRAYRIGQEKEVFVHLPILRDDTGRIPSSFDQKLDKLLSEKQKLAEDFLRPMPSQEQLESSLFDSLKEDR